jgi:hypothetical protein
MGLELDKQIVWSALKDLGAYKKRVSLEKLYKQLETFPQTEIDVIIDDLLVEESLSRPTETTIKLFY